MHTHIQTHKSFTPLEWNSLFSLQLVGFYYEVLSLLLRSLLRKYDCVFKRCFANKTKKSNEMKENLIWSVGGPTFDPRQHTFNLLVISSQHVLMAWTSSLTLSSSCGEREVTVTTALSRRTLVLIYKHPNRDVVCLNLRFSGPDVLHIPLNLKLHV